MASPADPIPDPATDKPPRPRRWIPVSVWIFAVVLIISAVGGTLWIGVRESRQNAAIQEIERLGGKIELQTRDFGRLSTLLGDNRLRSFSEVTVVRVQRPSDLNRISPYFGRLSPPPRLYVRDTLIHQSVQDGQIERAVEMLTECPLLIRARDNMHQTPLHVASHWGHVELVRLLIERGAEIDARAYNQFTPLHLAREPAIVDLLARSGVDLNAVGASGTALQHASRDVAHFARLPEHALLHENARSICALLLDRGADYDVASAVCLDDLARVRVLVKHPQQAQDKDAMRLACVYGRTAIVRLLLDGGAGPEDAGYGGLTPSYFAIEHPQVLEVLFDAGADPAVCVNYVGMGHGPQASTLLHEAAQKGAIASVQLLLGRGLSANARDASDNTPLHQAAFGGHGAIVELLLDHKADPTICNHAGLTALGIAASMIRFAELPDENLVKKRAVVQRLHDVTHPPELLAEIALGNSDTVERLLRESPALANQMDHSGEPPLQRAISLDQRQIVPLLLAAGADANGRDDGGRTALHTTAFWGREEITRTLLAHGADPNLGDRSAFTSLHETMRLRTWGVARILIDAGANIELHDDQGRTALDVLRRDQDGHARAGSEAHDPRVAEIIELLSKGENPPASAEPVADVLNLNLSGQDYSDEDLARLDGMQGLEWLALNRNPISDDGLRHVARLTSLKALRIEQTGITDNGLVHLQGLTRLEVLSLSGAKITDAGIARLLGLAKLRHLDLSHTQVSDVGLMQLKALTKLTELRVDRTRVTAAGIDKLQRALPRLKRNH